jgi:hypothetical protein
MEATLLLANSADASPAGLVYALGLRWSVTATPTPPAALVVLINVPWDMTNQQHTISLRLVNSDGHEVMTGQHPETGEQAGLALDGSFEVGRPPGIPRGTPIDQTMAIPLPAGLNLPAGSTYQWRMQINGEDVASRSFFVRPQ